MTDKVRPRGRGVLLGPCHPTTLSHLGIPAAHPNCHPDGAAIGGDWRDLQPGIPVTNENKTPSCPQNATRCQQNPKTEQLAVGASRPVDGMRKHPRLPAAPMGSRGRGPWSGRGSQRVKPRLVSPFERRRLFRKGQGFLRVVCTKAGLYLPRWLGFRVGDPSTRSTRSG